MPPHVNSSAKRALASRVSPFYRPSRTAASQASGTLAPMYWHVLQRGDNLLWTQLYAFEPRGQDSLVRLMGTKPVNHRNIILASSAQFDNPGNIGHTCLKTALKPTTQRTDCSGRGWPRHRPVQHVTMVAVDRMIGSELTPSCVSSCASRIMPRLRHQTGTPSASVFPIQNRENVSAQSAGYGCACAT